MRYGKDLKSPSASIQGPKVMIIDETAGSGGDMLPWMFGKLTQVHQQENELGADQQAYQAFQNFFLDGGGVTAPNVAIWTKDGFVVENVGVVPIFQQNKHLQML